MAGHSKWANIKHRKERADKKKGKIFSRIMKELISAVKQGGADPKSNAKLRTVIQKAKDNNIPNDNIERNIKKASSSKGADYTEMTYELYGFGGVGILVEILSDNKNRVSAEMQIAVNKCGGTIATPGAVSYNFDRKGLIRVIQKEAQEETLFLLATEKGAEDFSVEEDCYLITTPFESLLEIKQALQEASIPIEEDEIVMLPKNVAGVSDEIADQNITLIEWLENIEDVDAVFHNMKIL